MLGCLLFNVPFQKSPRGPWGNIIPEIKGGTVKNVSPHRPWKNSWIIILPQEYQTCFLNPIFERSSVSVLRFEMYLKPSVPQTIVFIFATLATLVVGGVSSKASDCRCMPGDVCWPSSSAWETLNSTVGGKLLATVPIGSPCHDPTYDEEACITLRAAWTRPLTQ